MQHHFKRHDRHNASGRPGRAGSGVSVQLEIIRGQARNAWRSVDVPAFLIGSAADCDLVLGDPQFSDVHAYVRLNEQGVSLRHLGFLPDLTVNGHAVSHAALADGDRVRTGPFEFVVHIQRTAGDQGSGPACPHIDLGADVDHVEDAGVSMEVDQLVDDIRTAIATGEPKLRLFDGGQGATPADSQPTHAQGVRLPAVGEAPTKVQQRSYANF